MRKVLLVLALLGLSAAAQSLDFAVGAGGVANGLGGVWPSASITLRLLAGAGVNFEDAIRATAPSGFNFRPQLMDINLVSGIPNPTRFKPEFMIGFAHEEGVAKCSNCVVVPGQPFSSSWYNGVHFGADLKIYGSGHVFIRPEYHFYAFSGAPHVSRFSLSVGYTFGGIL